MEDGKATAAATHRKIAQSADAIESSAAEQVDSADRRTELAADRTILAAERTYAAWMRTGLAAMASGIGARALLDKLIVAWLIKAAGATLALFAAFCFIAAVWREMTPSVRPPRPRARRIPAPMLIVINGILMLVALAACIGIITAS